MFVPSTHSEYGAASAQKPPPERAKEASHLRAAIRRTQARIATERRQIRTVKRHVAAAHAAKRPTTALTKKLHAHEFALHRDRWMLTVLNKQLGDLRHAAATAVAATLSAERQASRGDMHPETSVKGYPPPPTKGPAEKAPAKVAAEAVAEAADPAAADAHDEAVAPTPEAETALVPSEADPAAEDVPLYKKPLFWLGLGSVLGVGYWQRDNIGAMFSKKGA